MPHPDPIQIHLPPQNGSPCAGRLRAVGRELFRYRLLRGLRPYFHKLIAVTQPAGQIRQQNLGEAPPPGAFQALTAISANLCHDWPRFPREVVPGFLAGMSALRGFITGRF